MLLLAFWQEDLGFLTEVTFMLAHGSDRADIDVEQFQAELGSLMAAYRNVPLKEIQLGPIMQQMTAIALRHRIPLPASMTLTAKAMAQVQLATSQLDPELDPFDVAGRFLMRTLTGQIRARFDPRQLFYQTQKLRVRSARLMEALERLVGARPGPRMQVNFGAEKLEAAVRRAGYRLALGVTSAGALLGAAITASSARAPGWVTSALLVTGGVFILAMLRDLFRRRS
jgi:predicted unusual protein kinase regulating ubiquinone biosynthesis (AarF/ABC1/UbiB family)